MNLRMRIVGHNVAMTSDSSFVCFYSNMLGIVFITVVRRNLFSFPWNETEDLIKEPDVQPGLVSSFLGRHRSSGMFVYDRCGWLVDELNTMFPKSPDDITHEWLV